MADYWGLLAMAAAFAVFYLFMRYAKARQAEDLARLQDYAARKGWRCEEAAGEMRRNEYLLTPQTGGWTARLRDQSTRKNDTPLDGLTEYRTASPALSVGQILMVTRSLPGELVKLFESKDQGGLIGFASGRIARPRLAALAGQVQAAHAQNMQLLDFPADLELEALGTDWPDWLDPSVISGALRALEGMDPPPGTRVPLPAIWLDSEGLAVRLHFRTRSMTDLERLIAVGEQLSAQLRDERAGA